MNNKRRKQIQAIISDIDQVRADEQDYFDSMPENLQNGEKGERSAEVISSLESAIGELEDACS